MKCSVQKGSHSSQTLLCCSDMCLTNGGLTSFNHYTLTFYNCDDFVCQHWRLREISRTSSQAKRIISSIQTLKSMICIYTFIFRAHRFKQKFINFTFKIIYQQKLLRISCVEGEQETVSVFILSLVQVKLLRSTALFKNTPFTQKCSEVILPALCWQSLTSSMLSGCRVSRVRLDTTQEKFAFQTDFRDKGAKNTQKLICGFSRTTNFHHRVVFSRYDDAIWR